MTDAHDIFAAVRDQVPTREVSYQQRTRVNGICIVTDDVARLRSFYAEALRAEAEGDDTFTAFHTDGAALSLFSTAGIEKMAPGSTAQAGVGRYTLQIEVDDVDAEFDRLNKLGCVVVKPPTTQMWGRRSVWVPKRVLRLEAEHREDADSSTWAPLGICSSLR